jgi:hypothetical protein
MAESPAIKAAEKIRTHQLVDRRLGHSMRALDEHKARVDWATIHGAEATRSLVEVAASQETVLESMDTLLSELVERQDRMIDAQLREAKSNRRWGLALFLVAVVSSAAAVVGIVLGLLGILG